MHRKVLCELQSAVQILVPTRGGRDIERMNCRHHENIEKGVITSIWAFNRASEKMEHLDGCHPDQCGIVRHCGFDLHFSDRERSWTLFMCLLSIYISIYLLWRNVCLVLWPTFWWGCLFFWYWAACAACVFWRLILSQLFHLLLFSPILKSAFSPCL